jgi:hypothetical protein
MCRNHGISGTKLLPKDDYAAMQSVCIGLRSNRIRRKENAIENQVMGYSTADLSPAERKVIRTRNKLSSRARRIVDRLHEQGRSRHVRGRARQRYSIAMIDAWYASEMEATDQYLLRCAIG